jgi:5-methyltetrahydropteroyltriglutamate--homocysteine methyltransferase
VQFLRANTDRRIKITVPGPFTMTKLAQNDYYASDAELAIDYAAAVNAEVRDLFAAGADVVQIDEPYMQVHPVEARSFGIAALQRALDGTAGTTAVHICFGYGAMVKGKPARYDFLPELAATTVQQVSVETAQSALDCSVLAALGDKTVLLGVLDLSTSEVEAPAVVADRIRRALPYVAPERLIVAPDCGMKYLTREVAFGKLAAMVRGAALVRDDAGPAEAGHYRRPRGSYST